MNGTEPAPLVISFDTTGAIDEIRTGAIIESDRPEIQRARKLISVIVRIELLSWKKMDNEEYAKRLRFLDHVTVVPLNKAVEDEAITLRLHTSMKTADAIIAATAVKTGSTLLVWDDHFNNLDWPGLTVQKSI